MSLVHSTLISATDKQATPLLEGIIEKELILCEERDKKISEKDFFHKKLCSFRNRLKMGKLLL